MITQSFELNLIPGGVKPIVKASQYDKESRTLLIALFAGPVAFPVPDGAEVLIQGTKKDDTGFQYACTAAGNVVTATIEQQMTVFPGDVEIELQILVSGQTLGTGNFILQVEEAALKDDTIISETDIPIIQRIPEYVSEAAGYAYDAQESADEAAAVSKNLWYPTVNTDGDISWQKSTSETTPTTRNIKGPAGPTGATGPAGPTGATGNGIASVTKTGSSGLVDNYRITFTDGTTFDYTVTNGSGSTVTWTQTQQTGTKIAEIDINGVSQDVYAPAASSGGHTIVNASGTDMAQRTKMQFVDAGVTDDSANDRTKVNIVRTMTKAEMNSLSSAEKVGFIRTSDEADNPYQQIDASDVSYGSTTVEDALDDVNDELTTKYIKCRFVEQTVTFPANTSNISISFATELADIDSSSILTIIGVNIGSFGFPYIGNDGYTIIYSINKGTKTVVVNNTAGAWTNYKFRCLVFYT